MATTMTDRSRTYHLSRLAALLVALLLGLGFAAPAMADHNTDRDRFDFPSKWTKPLDGVVVGVDPGHNGGNAAAVRQINEQVADGRGGMKPCNTVGTTSIFGYPEHAFVFDVSVLLTERLEYLGATVVATREDDDGVGPCVDVRGRFAEDNDVDVFVSLHANGSESTAERGFFVIVADPPVSASQADPSHVLADAIVAGLSDGGFEPNPRIPDAVTGRDDLATLNFSRRPAVLVELGEMRNPDEAAVMQSEDGREQYAEALAQGVLLWNEATN